MGRRTLLSAVTIAAVVGVLVVVGAPATFLLLVTAVLPLVWPVGSPLDIPLPGRPGEASDAAVLRVPARDRRRGSLRAPGALLPEPGP